MPKAADTKQNMPKQGQKYFITNWQYLYLKRSSISEDNATSPRYI